MPAARLDAFAARLPGLTNSPAHIRQRIEAMEHLLEGLFVVPGINRRVGLDAIVGLVPVVGDFITGAMGLWIVWEARSLGMPKWQLARMTANIGIDTLLGSIPLVGDWFDLAFRSNTYNLRIIRKHLDRHHPASVTVDGERR